MRKQNLGEVRIIGGQWRGRKLRFPAVTGLRPTTDRIRETVFNWLQPVITGANCLDLFAGSGALGLEALSRHAAFVTFVDNNPAIIHYLQQQLALLDCQTGSVLLANAPQPSLAQQLQSLKKFDVVFLDPPFKQNLLQPCLDWLVAHELLAPNAYVYTETEISLQTPVLSSGWKIFRDKKTKEIHYCLLQTN